MSADLVDLAPGRSLQVAQRRPLMHARKNDLRVACLHERVHRRRTVSMEEVPPGEVKTVARAQRKARRRWHIPWTLGSDRP